MVEVHRSLLPECPFILYFLFEESTPRGFDFEPYVHDEEYLTFDDKRVYCRWGNSIYRVTAADNRIVPLNKALLWIAKYLVYANIMKQYGGVSDG